jgi:hypothetical protein
MAIGGLALFLHLQAITEPAAEANLATSEAVAVVATTTEQTAPAPVAVAETTDNAAPPLGPPIDITPSPTILDRMYGFDRASADISRAKRPAKKKPTEASARSAAPRRTAEIDPSRRETAPFVPRP